MENTAILISDTGDLSHESLNAQPFGYKGQENIR